MFISLLCSYLIFNNNMFKYSLDFALTDLAYNNDNTICFISYKKIVWACYCGFILRLLQNEKKEYNKPSIAEFTFSLILLQKQNILKMPAFSIQ